MGILMETTEVILGTARHLRPQPELFGAMGTPGEAFFSDTLHTIAINTRETEFGSIVEPIPITLKTYKPFQIHGHSISGYELPHPHQVVSPTSVAPQLPEVLSLERPSSSNQTCLKEDSKELKNLTRAPPKKKWIKEYMEEEPKSPPPVSVRVVTGLSPLPVTLSNGVLRASSPLLDSAPAAFAHTTVPAPFEFAQEHSRPRTTSISHGPTQIPSPPSVSSNGSGNSSSGSNNGGTPRAGTREVHNKLEKNRRAHLKECFELLKRQLPATPDDKKTSNLSILGSAIRYIQVLRRKERECEHEMERLAREKIAAQQRLAALKRDVTVRATVRPRSIDPPSEDKEREDNMNGKILGIPVSITSSPSSGGMEASPSHTLNLSTKLRTLPIQITPTTSQVVRTSYAARHNTLTLTTLAPADTSTHNGQISGENGVTNTLSTLVHPAQIHLPISQVVGSGGLVVAPAALQLLSTSGGLRVVQAPVHSNGVTTSENNRIHKENGIVSPQPVSTDGVVMSQLAPLVVSQPSHLLQTHTFTHKMVETQMVKGGVSPITVSTQYLSAAAIVKPVVVVSTATSAPSRDS